MNQRRHPLEIASWIAAIISALVGIALYISAQTEHKKTLPHNPPQAVVSMAPIKPNGGSVTGSRKSGGHTPSFQNSKCVPRNELRRDLDLVKTLSTFDEQDAGYAKLVDDYLCYKDFKTADKIASKLSTFSGQDANYFKIVKACIAAGDSKFAIHIANEMSTFGNQDKAKQMIIAGGK